MINHWTAIIHAGVARMYRVALCASVAVVLAACSLGSETISSGYNQPDTTASITSSPGLQSVALGGPKSSDRAPAVAGQQYAALDHAPKGSYEKAPSGALSDRDYTQTALDAERARDVINQYRHDKGLKPLKLNAELTEAAKAHSRDLAKWDRISHYGSDGSNPWDRVKRTGFKARLAAENVGTGQVNFNEVMRGWKESPGHNKNLLLPDATHMGIALVQDPRTEFKSFWTLVIGSPM
ncbi:MAG: CAP domain-containing protein [Hyphomicrobium sp.]|jgi:uncharacterized protein YkwD